MTNQNMRHIEPFVDSARLLDSPAALRACADEQGYLFFRSLLDRETVFDLRRQILEICRKYGWLDESASLMDGVAREGHRRIRTASREWFNFYHDVQRLRAFHALALDPAILSMFEILFGDSVLPHSRNIFRFIFPNNTSVDRPHQDNFYIGGSEETWTTWIPTGDCSAALGSLAVASGTHKLGKLAVQQTANRGVAVILPDDITWAGGDFHCGDVLAFHSLTIHQGQDNESGNRLRMSLDYRYQPISHPVRADSLEPHHHFPDGENTYDWENIYSGWAPEDPIKYYWQRSDLKIIPEK